MREVAEVKEMLRVVQGDPFGRADMPLVRWSKHNPPRFRHRMTFERPGLEYAITTEQEMEDLSAADIAKEALHVIQQLELPRLAEQQRIADLERDLADERAFTKRLLAELRQ